MSKMFSYINASICRKNNFLLALFFLLCQITFAQEVVTDLMYNDVLRTEWKQLNEKKNKLGNPPKPMTIGDTLNLPFIDDFSQTDVYPKDSLWLNKDVYINNSLSINPVTFGVASFDGVNHRGTPYNFLFPGAQGLADSLLSQPIRLDSAAGNAITEASNLFFSFYYQAQGKGNAPELEDSLVLYFKTKDGSWNHIWGMEGSEIGADTLRFKLVMIPITDSSYFYKGFQFMFRNYATLSGFLDVWNIDYVRLDVNRSAADSVFNDVAFVSMSNSLLVGFESIPWTHFYPNQSTYKKGSFTNDIVNLFTDTKFLQYDYVIKDKNNNTIFTQAQFPENISPLVHQDYIPQVNPSLGFDFPFESGDSTKFTLINRINTTPDFNRSNDSIIHEQVFYNYYAYDDGSVENGYGLNVIGGKLAYKFPLLKSDTIQGVYMYFTKMLQDVSQRTFKLVVWDALGPNGTPANVLYESGDFTPMYRDLPNVFYFYRFDVPTFIDNSIHSSIYVGWVQNTPDLLNIGLDRNNNNQSNMYFNTTSVWYPSLITGSWMIRPAFGGPVPSNINIGVPKNNTLRSHDLHLYPNPTSRSLFIQDAGNEMFTIYNFFGERISQGKYQSEIDVSAFPNGMYLLRLISKDGNFRTGKFTITH